MLIKTHGGLSILNALPTGLGSTCAIDLEVAAEVRFGTGGASSELLDAIRSHFRRETGKDFMIEIKTGIPSGGGLKSSSAVATAVIAGMSKLTGLEVDIPVLAAKLSLQSGLSVTGALDDAAAAYYGGVSVSDNRKMRLIKMDKFPEGIVFVVIPRSGRSAFDPESLMRHWPIFKKIANSVLGGNYIEAMGLNGLAVSEIFGYETAIVRKALELGALASGASGNGPSIFAAVKEGEEGPVLDLYNSVGEAIIAKVV
ncbi:MAG: shikimate kinase [Candidatus Thermoplasmatota archaeon]|nr:shikimate kinase [Candidatus Thermoplasmatota archaeon]MDA8142710.1 shikimate kinase [Thermoplasmatales archaeon]